MCEMEGSAEGSETMIIIGEKINATRKSIARALNDRDADAIVKVAIEQVRAGADYLDVNGGDPRAGKEVENMRWLMELICSNTDAGVAVDSADPEAAREGLSMARGKSILNSVSLESHRLESMLPIAADHDCMVIALLMSDEGTPTGVQDRAERAEKLIEKLTSIGKTEEEIIIDPCFLPISADPTSGPAVIDAIAEIHRRFPNVHIGGGVSNISYGLPKRRFVNLTALTLAIYHGMDVAIIDPCVEGIMGSIYSAEAVAAKDEFCMNYITAKREGKLV